MILASKGYIIYKVKISDGIKTFYKKIIRHRHGLLIYLGIITLAYFILVSNSFFYMVPQGGYDDGLQFRLAKSLSSGNWLGKYDSLTLAKGITYPAWTSFLHTFDIELWFGNFVLYTTACLSFIFAIRYYFTRKWLLAGVYALVLFNPMISPRAYRDSIAPAVCLFVVAWALGMFYLFTKIYSNKLFKIMFRDMVIFSIVGLMGLPMWWYLREDYFWILPFVICMCFISVFYSFRMVAKKRTSIKLTLKMILILCLPFIAVLATGTIISLANKHMYNRFVVRDYTSHDFGSAYGALTRIKDDNWRITVPVSQNMREKAYLASPAFQELQPCLDSGGAGDCEFFKYNTRAWGDYEGGWFFWAVRLAVEKKGYYVNAATPEEYYNRLAKEINQACDSGRLICTSGERASLAPAFNKAIIKPVINDIPNSLLYIYRLSGSDSVRAVKLDPYNIDREEMASYLNAKYRADQLNLGARLKRKIQGYIAGFYHFINPFLFTIAILIILIATIRIRRFISYWREIMVSWGLLMLIVARVVMLAYVDTTSFPAINTLYFSSTYPILFAFEGFVIAIFIQHMLVNIHKK